MLHERPVIARLIEQLPFAALACGIGVVMLSFAPWFTHASDIKSAYDTRLSGWSSTSTTCGLLVASVIVGAVAMQRRSRAMAAICAITGAIAAAQALTVDEHEHVMSRTTAPTISALLVAAFASVAAAWTVASAGGSSPQL